MEEPVARIDDNSVLAHQQMIDKARAGRIDVYFVGDSITRRWGCTDPEYAEFLAHWRECFYGWNAANFGWGGDTAANILWRLTNGELPPTPPRVFVILAGTNDVGLGLPAGTVADRVSTVVQTCRDAAPDAVVLLTLVLPRFDDPAHAAVIRAANDRLRPLAADPRIRLIDLSARFTPAMTTDGLHLNLAGYELWAEALRPHLGEILGPRAKIDEAPPPTGDPSARQGT